MSNSQHAKAPRGVTHVQIGQYEIQDVDGVVETGSEEEIRAKWMEFIEGSDEPNSTWDELKLVEVKAVQRRD